MKLGKYVWKVQEQGLASIMGFAFTVAVFNSAKQANSDCRKRNKKSGYSRYTVVKSKI